MEPLPNEDRTVWLTFNGEIYNFVSLRKELEALGHVFGSRTDAEVVVHGYEQWGPDVVTHLRGMFAFALWDQKLKKLVIARDRVGKKPLFYCELGGEFFFASEIHALLEFSSVPHDVDTDAIDAYLTWWYVPAPASGFRAIKKVPP